MSDYITFGEKLRAVEETERVLSLIFGKFDELFRIREPLILPHRAIFEGFLRYTEFDRGTMCYLHITYLRQAKSSRLPRSLQQPKYKGFA